MFKTLTKLFFPAIIIFTSASIQAQQTTVIIYADSMGGFIDKDIYGQFAEHLGHCIYGGIWVGEDSKIPNTNGFRNDVVEALKNLQVPVLRWPGGCFADEYHWMDGIGPRDQRPSMVNTNWGGVVEDNSFGTHEFLDFCELIGTEPYITGNVGSGTVQEFSQWVEYVNSDDDNPMANLRRQNGREAPWNVKYWGIGNESWGCGGRMRPSYYADLYRQYSNFTRTYGDNQLYRIATGPNRDDTTWTDVVMEISGQYIDGIALHYYTTGSRPATEFEEAGWFDILQKTLQMDDLIAMHTQVMDRHDPAKKVDLIVDEWGTWFAVEPGTNPGFLYQQNTLRDALVAATNLNIFHKYCERVKMTNIAQMINVLQAMILTDEEKMVLTPTYHIFEMFKVHQNAIRLPLNMQSNNYRYEGQSIPAVNGSASMTSTGKMNISLSNVNPQNREPVSIQIERFNNQQIKARILTAEEMNAHNTFANPENIKPIDFTDFTFTNGTIELDMPAKSVVVFEIEGQLNSAVGSAQTVNNPKPGLKYTYATGVHFNLPDYNEVELVHEDIVHQISVPENAPSADYVAKYAGYINLGMDGFYNFTLNSDDGAKLYIDGKLLINNDGRHAPITEPGFASLKKGFHKIEVEFFQAGGGQVLEVTIEGQSLEKQIIPKEMLYHEGE